ncbi:hypothetical protein VCJ71_01940 [Alteriqipengyuania sp. WL0013]|uniref:hypothetical protein n=1 Tax=Alteriqipengyuania sp. WL0013 TaxID=3110773 RepID=UPI002B9360BA|nr:hypothetical protein [Alteriqipengyuania sp. WL0013]MEB3414820.1 hypothetical protein [Alteriqipengyuania sp. WL0013]
MIKALSGALATAALLAAIPAAAQESQNNSSDNRQRDPNPQFQADRSGLETGVFPRNGLYEVSMGEVLAREPREFDLAYAGAHRIGSCLVQAEGYRQFEDIFADTRGQRRLVQIAQGNDLCFSRGARYSLGLIGPVMAEKLAIARSEPLPLESLAVTSEYAASFIGADELQTTPLDTYSRCLVATAPMQAFAVFYTEVGSRYERAALSALETATDQCASLEPEEDMRPSLQRATLAFAAFDWAKRLGTDPAGS